MQEKLKNKKKVLIFSKTKVNVFAEILKFLQRAQVLAFTECHSKNVPRDLDIVCPQNMYSTSSSSTYSVVVCTVVELAEYCSTTNKPDISLMFFSDPYFFSFSFSVPEISVSAVQGSSVELPCNLTAPIYGDKVRLVLWFKNDSSLPIYT